MGSVDAGCTNKASQTHIIYDLAYLDYINVRHSSADGRREKPFGNKKLGYLLKC